MRVEQELRNENNHLMATGEAHAQALATMDARMRDLEQSKAHLEMSCDQLRKELADKQQELAQRADALHELHIAHTAVESELGQTKRALGEVRATVLADKAAYVVREPGKGLGIAWWCPQSRSDPIPLPHCAVVPDSTRPRRRHMPNHGSFAMTFNSYRRSSPSSKTLRCTRKYARAHAHSHWQRHGLPAG